MLNGEIYSAYFVCCVIVEMDRRCSQSVRTLVFDDSDSDPPKTGQKKDLVTSVVPSSLNQSAEGKENIRFEFYFDCCICVSCDFERIFVLFSRFMRSAVNLIAKA